MKSDNIRDGDFEQLGKLEHLKALDVAYCPGLTFRGVKEQFKKFEKLEALGIGEYWQEEDLLALKELYPNFEIRRYGIR